MPRFDFPPLPKTKAPFPPADPLNTALADLSGLWIEPECSCARATSLHPLRLMAATYGWEVKLGDVLPRLKCKVCGEAPTAVGLTDDIQYSAPRVSNTPQPPRRIVMLPVNGEPATQSPAKELPRSGRR